jgi:hypothetical protein
MYEYVYHYRHFTLTFMAFQYHLQGVHTIWYNSLKMAMSCRNMSE